MLTLPSRLQLLGGQSVQAASPVLSFQRPAWQGWQVPSSSREYPGPHMQFKTVVLPSGPNTPSLGQGVQGRFPITSLYSPGGQARQPQGPLPPYPSMQMQSDMERSDEPVVVFNGHWVQEETLPGEKKPGAQSMHALEAGAGEYCPGRQALHSPGPVKGLLIPAGQAVQLPVLVGLLPAYPLPQMQDVPSLLITPLTQGVQGELPASAL